MFKGDIVFRQEKVSPDYTIAILERMFSFKDEKWKKELKLRARESIDYHLCVRVGNLDKIMNEVMKNNNNKKIVVTNVSTEIFGTGEQKDLVLYLTTE